MSTVEAYYDTETDLTWLANANAAAGSSFDTYSPGSGLMNWAEANAWAASLNINGVSGWRLPSTNPVDGVTYDYTYRYDGSSDAGYAISAPETIYAGSIGSEMAYLFYNTLGNNAYCTPQSGGSCDVQPGGGLTNTGPFSNIENDYYISATEYAPCGTDCEWIFRFNDGVQDYFGKAGYLYAWAVHSGDVGTPIVESIGINIDINPGSTDNPVNPKAQGVLPVAILTTEDFDASMIDVTTIRFGPGAAQPVHYALADVDGDTDWDLMLQFKTQDTEIVCGDTEVTLTGKTLEGVSFTGTDNIRTVGCK